MNTRTGKIARLPHALREQLNLRLADGEPTPGLLAWLNDLEPVQSVLRRYFDRRPISAQNLSEWKQGGFAEWQRCQETRALANRFLTEAEELGAECGVISLADQLSSLAALTLAQMLRAAVDGEAPDRRSVIFEILRELDRLRRGNHRQARVAFQRERWVTAHNAALEAAQKAEQQAEDEQLDRDVKAALKQAAYNEFVYNEGIRTGTLSPERQASMEAYFAARPHLHPDWRTAESASDESDESDEPGEWPAPPAPAAHPVPVAPPAEPAPAAPDDLGQAAAAQGKSNQIKPNQGRSKAAKPASAPAALPAPAAPDPRPQVRDAASDSSPNGDLQSQTPVLIPRTPSANRAAHDR